MWKNIVEPVRPQIIWRMRIACQLTKATDIHSEFVTCVAFQLQQWMHICASVLCYT
jgi:hypothetical protein